VDAAGAEEEAVTRAAAVLITLVACTACSGPEPPPFKPSDDVKQLMQGIVDPSADVV